MQPTSAELEPAVVEALQAGDIVAVEGIARQPHGTHRAGAAHASRVS